MKGAREYSDVLSCGTYNYGRLLIDFGSHARGYTLHIFVASSEDQAARLAANNVRHPPESENCVEVYGILGGQPGWSEWYGWIHRGKWVNDFDKFIESLKQKKAALVNKCKEKTAEQESARRIIVQTLLDAYR